MSKLLRSLVIASVAFTTPDLYVRAEECGENSVRDYFGEVFEEAEQWISEFLATDHLIEEGLSIGLDALIDEIDTSLASQGDPDLSEAWEENRSEVEGGLLAALTESVRGTALLGNEGTGADVSSLLLPDLRDPFFEGPDLSDAPTHDLDLDIGLETPSIEEIGSLLDTLLDGDVDGLIDGLSDQLTDVELSLRTDLGNGWHNDLSLTIRDPLDSFALEAEERISYDNGQGLTFDVRLRLDDTGSFEVFFGAACAISFLTQPPDVPDRRLGDTCCGAEDCELSLRLNDSVLSPGDSLTFDAALVHHRPGSESTSFNVHVEDESGRTVLRHPPLDFEIDYLESVSYQGEILVPASTPAGRYTLVVASERMSNGLRIRRADFEVVE